jgi:nucleotide-binding universal stress UspA family protein
MYSRILLPVDSSNASQLALNEAIQLAGSLGATIRLVHVIDVWSLVTSEATGAIYDTLFDIARREGQTLLQDCAHKVQSAGIPVDTVLVEQPDAQVGECLVHRARDYRADLIICGTHGRRGIRRLLVGSDAEYIVRHSPVPVLLVRCTEPVRDGGSPASAAAAHQP